MDIRDCPDCGGMHFGSNECPIKHPPKPIGWPRAEKLKCPGVGRDKDCISALLQFYFSRKVTDDEMRFLHEVMQRAVASIPSARNFPQGVEGMSESPRTTLSDGTQVYPEHRNIIKEGDRAGQQQGYVVLAEEERAKGFVRPVRRSYKHVKCGGVTTMGQTLAETYARDPNFYSGTFCCHCGTHFPVGPNGEFVWQGTDEKVGT